MEAGGEGGMDEGGEGVCKVTTQDTENFDEELQPLASARSSMILCIDRARAP